MVALSVSTSDPSLSWLCPFNKGRVSRSFCEGSLTDVSVTALSEQMLYKGGNRPQVMYCPSFPCVWFAGLSAALQEHRWLKGTKHVSYREANEPCGDQMGQRTIALHLSWKGKGAALLVGCDRSYQCWQNVCCPSPQLKCVIAWTFDPPSTRGSLLLHRFIHLLITDFSWQFGIWIPHLSVILWDDMECFLHICFVVQKKNKKDKLPPNNFIIAHVGWKIIRNQVSLIITF